jgi:hypothetical protein
MLVVMASAIGLVGCEPSQQTATSPSRICLVTLDPAAVSVDASATSFAVTASSTPDCQWSISGGTFLHPSLNQFIGRAVFAVAVDENSGVAREGAVQIYQYATSGPRAVIINPGYIRVTQAGRTP